MKYMYEVHENWTVSSESTTQSGVGYISTI